MAVITVRWSATEAPKPYASPFGVAFEEPDGGVIASMAVSGPDLVYYRQFQSAVLRLLGEVFTDSEVEVSDDPQRVWLDRLSRVLPPLPEFSLHPESHFDDSNGRAFDVVLRSDGGASARLNADSVFDYQEFQATVAHQTGLLFRSSDVEELQEPVAQQRRWVEEATLLLRRPSQDHALVERWPGGA